MSKPALIAIAVFIISLVLIPAIAKKTLTRSAKDFGGGNAFKTVALLSAAITIVVVLLLEYTG